MDEVARSLLPVPTVLCSIVFSPVRRAAWGFGRVTNVLLALFAGFAATALAAGRSSARPRILRSEKSDDEVIRRKSRSPREVSSVIVTFAPGAELPAEFKRFARVRGRLGIINGEVLDLPNGAIAQLERHPQIFRIHDNRADHGTQLPYVADDRLARRAAQPGAHRRRHRHRDPRLGHRGLARRSDE